jgi:hypothetical protein
MTRASISLPQALPQPEQREFLKTTRSDTWWLFPTVTLVYFLSFIIYSTWAALQGNHYYFAGSAETIAESGRWESQYLSPMYSPVLFAVDQHKPLLGSGLEPVVGGAPHHHAWFGEWPSWLPLSIFGILPLTPALLILWMPGGFRLTCYYYRGAYYKAFWGDPPNCAVGEPRKTYWGERSGPLVIQNIHRYFMYIALAFICILSYDAILSFIFVKTDASGEIIARRFGVGIGSLVITANVVLLALYTFGCHSLRHVVGGVKDCVSDNPVRYKAWQCVSCANRWHMQWAWISLFWVGFTDVYVRLCSMGIWSDWRII